MASDEFSLEGKVAIVTGAGRGIGKEISLVLAEAGAHIIAIARTINEIEQTAAKVRQKGSLCIAVPTDVTRASEVNRMVDVVISRFGKIDILLNQAGRGGVRKPMAPLPGYSPPGAKDAAESFELISEEIWHEVMDTNLTSVFLSTRAVVGFMIKQKRENY